MCLYKSLLNTTIKSASTTTPGNAFLERNTLCAKNVHPTLSLKLCPLVFDIFSLGKVSDFLPICASHNLI